MNSPAKRTKKRKNKILCYLWFKQQELEQLELILSKSILNKDDFADIAVIIHTLNRRGDFNAYL